MVNEEKFYKYGKKFPEISFWKMMSYQYWIIAGPIYFVLQVILTSPLILLMVYKLIFKATAKEMLMNYLRTVRVFWHNGVALWAYPIYYYNRKWEESKVYKHISENDAINIINSDHMTTPDIYELKELMSKESAIAYWLWGYGDIDI